MVEISKKKEKIRKEIEEMLTINKWELHSYLADKVEHVIYHLIEWVIDNFGVDLHIKWAISGLKDIKNIDYAFDVNKAELRQRIDIEKLKEYIRYIEEASK